MKKIASLCLALLLAGCAEGPSVPVSNPKSPETAGAPIVLFDGDLKDDLAVDVVRIGPNANNYLTVQANLRNRTDSDLEIQVQTLFYNSFGRVLNNEPGNQTAWTNVQLTANETMPYASQAIDASATRATVRVRYLHRPRHSDWD
ncbi:MAG: hypothetical protein PW734_11825 [Verrucomicrobium sp.]|nr:hypothetical protein [Verrucomicrobium sp.]